MTDDDVIYYTRRATAGHERAAKATRPEVIQAHQILASVYRDRIAAARPQMQPQIDHV